MGLALGWGLRVSSRVCSGVKGLGSALGSGARGLGLALGSPPGLGMGLRVQGQGTGAGAWNWGWELDLALGPYLRSILGLGASSGLEGAGSRV